MTMASAYDSVEAAACRSLIALALREDLGEAGDLTSLALLPLTPGTAAFVARAPGVLAGLAAAQMTLAAVDLVLAFRPLLADGAVLKHGDTIAVVTGPIRSIMTAERTALNFLQRLSGVATQTRKHVDLIAGLPVQLLDTRKTTPGWRPLEKHAVRTGGGHNHRSGLYDMMLIKDNHLAALADDPDPIGAAVRKARASAGPSLGVEIEVESLDRFDRALQAAPDIILLDNMAPVELRECARRRNAARSKVLLEASGGISLQTLRAIAETGVDRISIGALTHSAPALDLALDYGAG
jgi:nicotinate-nucleotide pyrophosphorylase (carboxylating)